MHKHRYETVQHAMPLNRILTVTRDILARKNLKTEAVIASTFRAMLYNMRPEIA